MPGRVYIAVEALLTLAIEQGRKRGDETKFLARLNHALWSYELKGGTFLERHYEEPAVWFLSKTILPLIHEMSPEEWMHKKLLIGLATAVTGAYESKVDGRIVTHNDKLDLTIFGNKTLRKARSRM